MATKTSDIHAKAIGREIARARQEAELTQAELAAQLGVHPSYVAGVETGRANLTVGQLAHLARALGAQLRVELRSPKRHVLEVDVIDLSNEERHRGLLDPDRRPQL